MGQRSSRTTISLQSRIRTYVFIRYLSPAYQAGWISGDVYYLAERKGFEPSLRINAEQLSKLVQYRYAYLSMGPVN